jgi:diguanylate cyclase (GGDEF)-like protein/PAS domain S-box-containing protein
MDMRMIFGIQIMVFLVCFVILIQEWIQHRNRYKGLSCWMVMMFCGFIGYALIALRGIVPEFLSIIVGNFLNIVAFGLFYTGLIYFFRIKAPFIHNIFIVLVATILLIYFTYFIPSLAFRIVVINITYIIIFAQALYLFLFRIKTCHKGISYIFIINISLLILLNVYRTIMKILDKSDNQDFFNQNIHENIYFIVNMIVLMYLMINLSMLVSRRLLNDVTQSEEKFNTIFHQAPYASLITEAETGIIIEVNREMLELMGYKREEVIGRSVLELKFYTSESRRTELINLVTSHGNISGVENEFVRKDGSRVKTLFSANSIKINDKNALISTMKDITEITNLREKLDYLATHDMLTGLPNRRYFHESFRTRIDDLKEKDQKFVVAIFDIDGFKRINDTYGHDAGDKALKQISKRANDFFKDKGFIARFGGDEFAILFNDEKMEYRKVLSDFKKYVDSSDVKEEPYNMTISIGAVICPDNGTDQDVLLKIADDALFHVKKNGKNGISFYSDIA